MLADVDPGMSPKRRLPPPLRVLYATGPGDVIGTYHHWITGRDDPSDVTVSYSAQFYNVCQEYGLKAYVISPCRRVASVREGQFTIQHRPIPWADRGGILYHLGRLNYGLRLVMSAVRFRPHVAIVTTGTHWFVLWPLRLLRIRVVPSLHCVLRSQSRQRSTVQRLISTLDRTLLAHGCFAIMTASSDIGAQLGALTKSCNGRLIPFLPLYRHTFFSHIPRPTRNGQEFRVLYAGRIERNKGVFDLLAVAKRLASAACPHIVFDICGSGSALEALTRETESAGLESRFLCHGHCDRTTMTTMFGRSHIVVVPTTTEFAEGFNQVVVEAVLAGRPVVTSAVCPALSYVRDAAVEVTPNSVVEYFEAILRLRNDQAFYESKRAACSLYQEAFYNPDNSWGDALKRVLTAVRDGCEVTI